jgi:hypothetical protein
VNSSCVIGYSASHSSDQGVPGPGQGNVMEMLWSGHHYSG